MSKGTSASKSKNKAKKPAEKKDREGGLSDKEDDAGSPFNFGGLPHRDLKKNLGCG
jgi:hypothetical protein